MTKDTIINVMKIKLKGKCPRGNRLGNISHRIKKAYGRKLGRCSSGKTEIDGEA